MTTHLPADSLLYEYAVVRYVPRIEREEFINIGLVMMCRRQRWLKGDIYINPERIEAFHPGTNIDLLAHQASMFLNITLPSPELAVEERYRWLTAVKSAILQVSPSHPGFIPFEGNMTAQRAAELLTTCFNNLFTTIIS